MLDFRQWVVIRIIANLWVIFGQADFSFRKNLLLILCIHHGIKDKIEGLQVLPNHSSSGIVSS